ncbi:hypothetical protein F441_01040 [Phytophthora nicotianae CJ01A1]|uniref:Uncharacterized protein n=1 Tax=Phytophthora nicotianae CJ01A1 TaxID=1317063 RepID=W2XW73_PHYNI|nr:hypothetical protein F441_01040 [Phytophthora nicotianae CJ01A1]
MQLSSLAQNSSLYAGDTITGKKKLCELRGREPIGHDSKLSAFVPILGSIEIELLWMSDSYAVAGVSVQSVFYEFFEPLE